MAVATDVCACEYTDHGHCGIVGETTDGPDLQNDPSLALMARIAVSHARAAPISSHRRACSTGWCRRSGGHWTLPGYQDVLVMSYSSKFASALYGPFRDAADSGFRSATERPTRSTRQRPRGG